MLQTIENVFMCVLGLSCLVIIFGLFPKIWREAYAKVRVCGRCGSKLTVKRGQHILSCDPVFTPYTKKDQTTRVERHTHGLG